MKAPNLTSLLLGLLVVAPAVATAITQQFPPETFWWSMLVTGILGTVVKVVQVLLQTPAPKQISAVKEFGPMGGPQAMSSPEPAKTPSRMRAIWLQ